MARSIQPGKFSATLKEYKMTKIQNIYDNPSFFAGYQSFRKNNQGFHDVFEQPAMRSLLPDLKEMNVLDIG